MLIWIFPFILLFQIFTPYNNFYRLFYILPLAVFLIKGVSGYWGSGKIRFSGFDLFNIIGLILIVIFLSINFGFGFLPESKQYNNPLGVFANDVSKKTSDNVVFIFFGEPDIYFKYRTYLRYFGKRDVFLIWQYQSDKHSQVQFDRIDEIADKTEKWLKNSHEYTYIVNQEGIEFAPYNLIIPPDSKPGYPETMIIRDDMFEDAENIDIAGMQFYRLP